MCIGWSHSCPEANPPAHSWVAVCGREIPHMHCTNGCLWPYQEGVQFCHLVRGWGNNSDFLNTAICSQERQLANHLCSGLPKPIIHLSWCTCSRYAAIMLQMKSILLWNIHGTISLWCHYDALWCHYNVTMMPIWCHYNVTMMPLDVPWCHWNVTMRMSLWYS